MWFETFEREPKFVRFDLFQLAQYTFTLTYSIQKLLISGYEL